MARKKLPPISRKMKRLLKDYVNWAIENSWKGARDPESFPEIERMHYETKENLYKYLSEVESTYELE